MQIMAIRLLFKTVALIVSTCSPAQADEGIDSGKAWMFVATALVMMTTPAGLALFYGNPKQLWLQAVSIAGTLVFSAAMTLAVVTTTRLLAGPLRIDKDNESIGLDSAFHGEHTFDIQG